MVHKILQIKNPKLRTKSKSINKIDKKILDLVTSMRETLVAQKDPEGVGLAAPQIGKNVRLFMVSYNGIEHIMINPNIVDISAIKIPENKDKNANQILEGCLSLPHFYSPVKRAKKLTLQYMNLDGQTITREFKGFLAHIIQHEVDHLNGVLFVDRVLEQKMPLYKFSGEEYEEVKLI